MLGHFDRLLLSLQPCFDLSGIFELPGCFAHMIRSYACPEPLLQIDGHPDSKSIGAKNAFEQVDGPPGDLLRRLSRSDCFRHLQPPCAVIVFMGKEMALDKPTHAMTDLRRQQYED